MNISGKFLLLAVIFRAGAKLNLTISLYNSV